MNANAQDQFELQPGDMIVWEDSLEFIISAEPFEKTLGGRTSAQVITVMRWQQSRVNGQYDCFNIKTFTDDIEEILDYIDNGSMTLLRNGEVFP